MTAGSAGVAATVAAAVWWVAGPTPGSHRRLQRLAGVSRSRFDRRRRPSLAAVDRSASTTVAAVTLAIAAWLLVGGWLGLLVAVGGGTATRWWLLRLPTTAQSRAAAARTARLPLVVDLLAAGLAAGAPPAQVVGVVADTLALVDRRRGSADDHLVDQLHRVAGALASGAASAQAWAGLPADLDRVGEAFVRSSQTGSSITTALTDIAADLRTAQRQSWREAAARVGVASTLPMGLCFLPAFVLIGVVPTVVGLFSLVR
jgi:hypothetical protein